MTRSIAPPVKFWPLRFWPQDIFAPAVAMVILAIVSLMGALFYVTRSADLSVRSHEEAVIANGVNVQIGDIADSVALQVASVRLSSADLRRPDPGRLHTQIGAPLHENYGFDYAVVRDAAGAPVYAMDHGEATSAVTDMFTDAAAPLIEAVRQTDALHASAQASSPTHNIAQASAVATTGGRSFVLTATLLRPDAIREQSAVRPLVLVSAKAIDDAFLGKLSEGFLLDALTLRVGSPAEEGQAQAALVDANGVSVATLTWWPPTPGAALLRLALWPLFILIAALGVVGWTFYRRGQRAARALMESEVARQSVAESDRVKSEFINVMSHELRTPLNGIIGYAEILEEDLVDANAPDGAKDAGAIRRLARHLLGMIEQILTYSQIEAGQIVAARGPTDVAALASAAVKSFEAAAAANGDAISAEIADDIGVRMLDGARLKECIDNLLSNAVKFTSNGTICLQASVECDGAADWLRLEVVDTGRGMSPEQQLQLGQPFSQGERGATRSRDGAGLGMTVTMRTIRLLGGTVACDSEVGKGSRFTLRLPAPLVCVANGDAEPVAIGALAPGARARGLA